MINLTLKEISPLFSYWESPQKKNDEERRLLLINVKSPVKYLIEKEPYKWENLFQSIIREIINGDQDSIKGLKLLLNSLEESTRKSLIDNFKNKEIFSHEIIDLLNQPLKNKGPTKRNILRFLRILFAIFLNPYNIEVKSKKNHIYERTGYYFLKARKLLNL